MNINFIVEDFGAFKYLGCATAAKNLYKSLSKKVDIKWNEKSTNFDIAHFHTFGPKSLLYARKFRGKKIITAHSTPNLNRGNVAFLPLVNLFYRPIYKKFDHIISVSNKCKREIIKEMKIKVDVKTIYNGIDTKKFKPDMKKRNRFRETIGAKKNDIVVLTVAQRTPRKGIYDFLELAKKNSQLKFLWIGEFPYKFFSKDYFKISKIIKNKGNNTVFPGFIKDIREAYSAADVFFMPSYAEGHSIVMLESLSMGLPMIARDNEEFREAFGDNLIYFKNVNQIDESFFDKKLLRAFKKKADIVKKYDIEKISNEHIRFYEDVLAN